tara:strand:+ start:1155 stop:1439 length:285 start_codon:yes stop_codon:yes gene_type:complete
MTDFVDHLTRLAPEGETFLLVRQKPQIKEGQIQYHPDGAVKATWPSMLPTAKVKPDWAIYGNTVVHHRPLQGWPCQRWRGQLRVCAGDGAGRRG